VRFALKALFIALAVVLLTASYGPINLYDEGIILLGGQRVLHGDVPYRDFWVMYPPGSFFLNALLFSIFGEHALLNRVVDGLIRVAIVLLAYRILRSYSSARSALFVSALVGVFLLYLGYPGFPVFPATLIALGIVRLFICADERVGRTADRGGPDPLLFAAGALNGLMVYFRHDLAAYTFVAVVISILHAAIRAGGHGGKWPRVARELVPYTIGVTAAFLPLALYVLVYAGFEDTYFALIESPANIYPLYRSVPFPRVDVITLLRHPTTAASLMVYFPLVILTFACVAWASSPTTTNESPGVSAPHRDGSRSIRIAVLLAAMAALFCLKGTVRPHVVHFAPAIVASLVLAGCLMRYLSPRISMVLVVVLLVFFVAPARLALVRVVGNVPTFAAACREVVHPTLACVPADAATVSAARFIEAEMPEVKDLYVGAGRHDRIFVGNVAAYFIAAKRPVTKWHELHPGIQTRADIQREIISELRCSHSVVVMLDRRWDGQVEQSAALQPSGSRELDRFLMETFVAVKEFESIIVLARAGRGDDANEIVCAEPKSER
jgi:hypothetical protein